MSRMHVGFCAAVATLVAIGFTPVTSAAIAAAKDYSFELAGKPAVKAGVSTVLVRLVHLPDRKAVAGAVIFQTRADMGPEQMAAMAAPVKALPVPIGQPGVYAFEIQNGSVWTKPGKWALSLAAKVQGEPETVRGTVNLDLHP